MDSYVSEEIKRAQRSWIKKDLAEVEEEARQKQLDLIWIATKILGTQEAVAKVLSIAPSALTRYKKSRDMPFGKVAFLEEGAAAKILEKYSSEKGLNEAVSSVCGECSLDEIEKITRVLDLKFRVELDYAPQTE